VKDVVLGQFKLHLHKQGESTEDSQLVHAEVRIVVAVFRHEHVWPPYADCLVVGEVSESELVAGPVSELDLLGVLVEVNRIEMNPAEEAPLLVDDFEVLAYLP